MIQQIIVGIVFSGALVYVGNLLFKSFRAKSACSSGCGKCGAVDFQKIEAQIKKEGL
ncbi:MAG: FeoB-associated Cys-rich membrane protein [Marivirga sp.]|nr:FeoB-associated Cys-rich membrane protein [Marivirga sp.]